MTQLTKGQPGYKRTIALIVVLGSAGPIATDIYLPALPQMPGVFNTSEALVSLTLMSFFAFMAIGTLIFGPISDKFGRRRPLLTSVALFATFALSAALSTNIWVLIFSRVLQGIGGGGMMAISMALVKDCFAGRIRETVLVIIQAAGVVAPMCAPVLGSVVLEFVDWRGCFMLQMAFGLIGLALVLPMKEPLAKEDRTSESIPRTIGRLFVVGRNKSFIVLLAIVAILMPPMMGYLSCASYIYIDFFDLGTFQYSAFFAANAGLSVLGAGLALVVSRRFPMKANLTGIIIATFIAGIAVLTLGKLSPFAFFAAFGILSLAGSASRPLTTNLLLDQQDGDTGSVSSLINFTCTMSGCLGMALMSLPWSNYITGLGSITACVALIAFVAWMLLLRSRIEIRGL